MKTINLYFDFKFTSLSPDAQPISLGIVADVRDVRDYPLMTRPSKPGTSIRNIDNSKSFYAEFSDFDINRCDGWVRENVVGKLRFKTGFPEGWFEETGVDTGEAVGLGRFIQVKSILFQWLKQFSDYQIQFVCDCGTFDWYWMLQLLAEWEEKRLPICFTESEWGGIGLEKFQELYGKDTEYEINDGRASLWTPFKYKYGPPKLSKSSSS